MEKIKLSKGELKHQRDALHQYQRYLPTLQLKKQQLQMEILHQTMLSEDKERQKEKKLKAVEPWVGLLHDPAGIEIKTLIAPSEVFTSERSIAGVDIPIFTKAEFAAAEYDLFLVPLWVDSALEQLRELKALQIEIATLEKGIAILRQELRITAQRVNLFEKVKIPQAEEAIRQIKIYLGDQMANAVGRSKIAKRKIEEYVLEEVVA